MRCFVLSTVLLLSASRAWAQENPASEPSSFRSPFEERFSPIDLEVEGDTRTTRAEVLAMFPSLLERELTPSQAREILRQLYDTGKYRSAELLGRHGPAGDVLLVVLKARLYINEISFSGLDNSNVARVERVFGIKKGDEFVEDRAARQGELVRLALFEMGYRSAEVTVFESKKTDGVELVVSVELDDATRVGGVWLDAADEMKEQILPLLALRPGQIYDRTKKKEDLRALRGFIRGLGYYDAQIGNAQEEIVGDKINLRYPITLGARYEVEFRGLSSFTKEEAMSILRLEEEGIIASSTLGAASLRLKEALEEKGFALAEVSGAITAKVDNFRLLHFEVNQGKKVQLSGIQFEGSTRFSRKQLLEIAKARLAAGITPEPDPPTFALDTIGNASGRQSPYKETPTTQRPLKPYEIYRPKAISQTVSEIKKKYLALGYESILVEAKAPIWSDDGTNVSIIIHITEGPQTKVSNLKLEGNKAISRKEVLQISPLQPGGPFTEDKLEQLRAKTVELYTTKGYLYAKIDINATRNKEKTKPEVAIALTIEEGPQVLFAGSKIEGNQELQTEAIRHYIRLEKGEIITPDKMREIQRRLLSLGIFESVSIEPEKKDTPEEQKVLVISVRERKLRAVGWGVGVSSADGPRGQVSFSHGDTFNQMLPFSLQLELNDSQIISARKQDEQEDDKTVFNELEGKAIISLRDPLLGVAFGSPVSGEVFAVGQKVHRTAFDVSKGLIGLSVGTSAEQKQGLSFSLQTDLEANSATVSDGQDLDAIRATLPQAEQDLLEVFEGQTILASVRPQLTYDLRDDPFNATRGAFFQINTEASRSINPTGSELNFVSLGRVQATAAAYAPYRRLSFQWVLRGGMVLPFSSKSSTPPDRLFFVGGTTSVRGFPEEGLLPQDFSDSLIEAIAIRQQESHGIPQEDFLTPVEVPKSLGSSSFISLSNTVRFPLPKLPKFEGSVFLDLGNGWAAPLSFDPFVLRSSVGAGLRRPTAIGPIRLEVALKLDRREELEAKAFQIHFALGSF